VPLTPVPLSASPSRSSLTGGVRLDAQPLISVVVPTRDRPEPLRCCLAALADQTVADRLEVVVVDDGSLAYAAVAAAVAEHSNARLIRQRGRGPASARNTGVASARAGFICFTDDDCAPIPTWAQRLAESLRTGAAAVAGRTISGHPHSALAAASDLIVGAPGMAAGPSNGRISFAPSNNIGCRADVLAAIPFDERYPAAAAEDRDWCARLEAAGYSLLSEPAAVVVHWPGTTIGSFLRQQLRYGRGAFWFRRLGDGRRRFEPPAFYGALLRRAFIMGWRIGVLVSVAQVVTALGFALEWRRVSSPKRSPLQSDRESAPRPQAEGPQRR
jgi:glycosyltransferase involved in cell wall biosynthesis